MKTYIEEMQKTIDELTEILKEDLKAKRGSFTIQ